MKKKIAFYKFTNYILLFKPINTPLPKLLKIFPGLHLNVAVFDRTTVSYFNINLVRNQTGCINKTRFPSSSLSTQLLCYVWSTRKGSERRRRRRRWVNLQLVFLLLKVPSHDLILNLTSLRFCLDMSIKVVSNID